MPISNCGLKCRAILTLRTRQNGLLQPSSLKADHSVISILGGPITMLTWTVPVNVRLSKVLALGVISFRFPHSPCVFHFGRLCNSRPQHNSIPNGNLLRSKPLFCFFLCLSTHWQRSTWKRILLKAFSFYDESILGLQSSG